MHPTSHGNVGCEIAAVVICVKPIGKVLSKKFPLSVPMAYHIFSVHITSQYDLDLPTSKNNELIDFGTSSLLLDVRFRTSTRNFEVEYALHCRFLCLSEELQGPRYSRSEAYKSPYQHAGRNHAAILLSVPESPNHTFLGPMCNFRSFYRTVLRPNNIPTRSDKMLVW